MLELGVGLYCDKIVDRSCKRFAAISSRIIKNFLRGGKENLTNLWIV